MITDFFRAAADVVVWAASEAGSRVLDAIAPLPNRQPVTLDTSIRFYGAVDAPDRVQSAADARKSKGLRVICRGLGQGERGSEWVDKDGDRWRWNRKLGSWQNKMQKPDICTSWYAVPTEDGTTSAAYAPYTEVVGPECNCGLDGYACNQYHSLGCPEWNRAAHAPSAVVVAAPASGPPAEVKVPGADPEAPAPGTPSRVNPDAAPVLREAAKALRGWTTGQRMVEELLPYWRNVAHCLDIYADECDWNAHPVKHAK